MKISGNLSSKENGQKNAREKFVKTNEDVCLLLFDGITENLDKKKEKWRNDEIRPSGRGVSALD